MQAYKSGSLRPHITGDVDPDTPELDFNERSQSDLSGVTLSQLECFRILLANNYYQWQPHSTYEIVMA